MRRSKQNRKRFSNYNLGSVICGFLILMAITAFMVGFQSYNDSKKALAFADLALKYDVIVDEEVYLFMNDLFHRDSVITDKREMIKMNCISFPHDEYVEEAVENHLDTLVTEDDIDYMLDQLSSDIMLWDSTMLTNCWLLKPSDFALINNSDTTDYWEEYVRVFGNYGLHNYSPPIFNKSKTIAILEHSGSGGGLLGSGSIMIFFKINGEWRYHDEISLWIS